MSKATKFALSVMAVLLLVMGGVVFMGVTSYIKYHDIAASSEAGIKSADNASRVALGSMGNKILDVAAVPEMSKTHLLETTRAAISGRYGDGGSKAVFQAIREVNPTVDPSLYVKVQQVVDSERNKFVVTQNVVIDRMAAYETLRNSVWSGFWIKFAGYPKMDLTAIKPVTSERADNAFTTGREESILQPR